MKVGTIKLANVVLLLVVALYLAGCGGSSSSSSDTQSNTLTGYVADGYLSGATVFLDCNNNRILDADEKSISTDAAGQYVLDTTGVADAANCPVVAEVTETTVDLDTNLPVDKGYTLASPPGYTSFVSPLTTMIQVNYESNPGITVQEAHDAVKVLLEVDDQSTVSLFEDYIVNTTAGGTDADTYEDMHKFAQITARVLGDNLEKLEQAAENQNFTITDEVKDDFLRMTMKEIMQNAELITEVIEADDPTGGDTDFDPDTGAQVVQIEVDTSDVSDAVEQEQTLFQNKVPTLKWAGIFRAFKQSGTALDIFALGLENDIDTDGYTFSVEGPQQFSYTFTDDDFYNDPFSPVALNKVYWGSDLLTAGEYIFYITPPDGTAVEVARDTHDTDVAMPFFSSLNPSIMVDADGTGSLRHRTLDGTYYYRIAIRDAATEENVYRTKRMSTGVRTFPGKYATADYQYRVEAWNSPRFSDATARSQTNWNDFTSVVNVGAEGAAPAYYGAYWRRAYQPDGTTIHNNRKILDIAFVNHTDLAGLTVTGSSGFSHTFPVSAEVGTTVNDSAYWFEKYRMTLSDGNTAISYYLQIKNSTSDAETFTWSATTASGGDFTVSATIPEQTVLPCVAPASVTMVEDSNGLLTASWDGVTSSTQGQGVFYRLRLRNSDTKAQFRSKRVPDTTLKIPRSEIEAAIGTDLTGDDVQYRIEVFDSAYYTAIHNWTQFNYRPFTLE